MTNLYHECNKQISPLLKIPYIDWARSFSSKPIRLFASPWTAPAWMKTNNQFYGLGRLKQEYFQVWAEYFVRYNHLQPYNITYLYNIRNQSDQFP